MTRLLYTGLLTLAYILHFYIASGCMRDPPPLPHGHVLEIRGRNGVGRRYLYECHQGYFLAGVRGRRLRVDSYIVECDRGFWKGPRNVPPRTDCFPKSRCHANPRAPANGRMNGHCCDDLDTVTFQCNSGYRLAGAQALQCSQGRWNGTAPKCTRGPVCISQEQPNSHIKSRRSGRVFMPNDVISYRCNQDHYFEKTVEVEGVYEYGDEGSDYASPGTEFVVYDYVPRAIKCLPNGRWNISFPQCHVFTCEPPSAIANGQINLNGPPRPTYMGGHVISYTCNQGFMLVGLSHRVCSMKSGGWTGDDDPTCKEVSCPLPKAPENGIFQGQGNKEGDTIRISCNRGYTLLGSANMTCTRFGSWSGVTPICRNDNLGPRMCQNPVVPFGGRKTGARRYELNAQVRFSCNGNNRLVGPATIRCTQNGWHPSRQPKCVVPFSNDDPAELAAKFSGLFDKLGNKSRKIEENSVMRGRYLDPNSPTGLDIYFLIDSSSSVTRGQFVRAVDFVKELVKKVGVTNSDTGARVGVTTFSDNINMQFGLNNGFHASEKHPLERILQLLDKLNYSTGSTNIREALEFVRDMMLPLSLQSRQGAKQYLFLLSDGEDNVGGDPEPIAQELKNPKTPGTPKMEIFCIRIGLSTDAEKVKKNEEKLEKISSEQEMNQNGDDPHFFRLENFPALGFLVDQIVKRSVDYTECGVAGTKTGITSANIIGGQVSADHAWPWMASILVKQPGRAGYKAFKHSCGGTLINSEWVLSAAHCFQGDLYEDNLDRILVKLGSNTWAIDEVDMAMKTYEVKSMHIHRGWKVNTQKNHPPGSSWEDDIALLRLKKSARLNSTTRSVCLAEKTANYSEYNLGVVTGWGFAENRTVDDREKTYTISEDLRQVELRVTEKGSSSCVVPPQEKIVCAGSTGTRDSCHGDSGGPLMVQSDKDDKGERRWSQIGIVSYGIGCARGNGSDYGRYTDVRHYRDWIKKTMRGTQ